MTARKPVHPPLSTESNVTFLENTNIESDSDDSEESINVPGSPTKQATPEVDIMQNRKPKKRPKEHKMWLYVQILVIIIGMVCIRLFWQPSFKSCSFEKLQQQTPRQPENVWKALKVGIENMLNKKLVTPNVYLFLYQDPKLKKLTDDIAKETARCFGNKGVIEMRSEDFIPQEGDDYGYAIKMYKQKIKDGQVLVIINLNKIPANAARALHAICDTINPIAKDVVIFLTLNPSKPVNPNTNSVQLAVDTLQGLWGKHLGSNELEPLITRVTDQVLHLTP